MSLRSTGKVWKLILFICALMYSIPTRAQQVSPSADGKRSLAELVRLALQNTQILGAQDARAEEKRLSASQARTWPSSSLDFSAGQKQEDSINGPTHELTFTQPLPLLGKPGLQGGLLDLEAESWRIRRVATQIFVTLNVIQSAYEYTASRQKADFAEKRQKRFELIYAYLTGREFPTPQLKAESHIVRNWLKSLVSDAVQSQGVYEASFEKLKVYVPLESGKYPNVEVPWLAGAKALNKEELLAKALENNPDLRVQRLAVKSAELDKILAFREGFPDSAIGISYETDVAASAEKIFGLGLSLTLPPWNRNRAGIRSVEQRKVAEERQLAFEVQKLEADLSRLFVEYEAARQVAQQYPQTLLPELEAQLLEVAEGFRKGQVDLLTLLELDSSASETFSRVLDAQLDLAVKIAELMAVAGEQDALAQFGSF